MSGRPVSSNYGYYTENIASYLDDHLKSLTQNIKLHIKVLLYSSIPNSEGLTFFENYWN